MTFASGKLSDATYRIVLAVRDRMREELRSVEIGETVLPADELSYLQAKLSGLNTLIEDHELIYGASGTTSVNSDEA